MDKTLELLQQPKGNQKENLRLDLGEIRRFFPKNYTTERIAKTIMQLLEQYERKWRKTRDAR